MGTAVRCFLQLVSSFILMGWVAPLSLPSLVVIMLGFYLLFLYYQVKPSSYLHPIMTWDTHSTICQNKLAPANNPVEPLKAHGAGQIH